jgi:hypothetical protein
MACTASQSAARGARTQAKQEARRVVAQKRVVRVLSYEGNEEWLDAVLARSPLRAHRLRTLFRKQGTIKELHCVEIKDGERLRLVCETEKE